MIMAVMTCSLARPCHAAVWFLNAHLPRACCDEECLLFDSMTMGAAYNSMRKSTEMHGCTLIAIKDKVQT